MKPCDTSVTETVLAKVLEITSPSGNVAEKPCIFLEGGIHSREWIATSTVLYIAGVGREDASHAMIL